MKKSPVILFLLLFAFGASAQTPPALSIKAKIQSALDSMYHSAAFPGVTFSLITADGKQLNFSSGMADEEHHLAMKPASRMFSGSIGKTYFASAVLVLVQQGRMSLDDKISKFIGTEPWFTRIQNAGDLTIRMLMNHTSGIDEYYELGDFMEQLKDPQKVWTPLETIAYVFDRKPLFAAGTNWSYADTNYLILGLIVEKITGKKMYDLAATYSLKPYKLKDTEPSTKRSYVNLATGNSNPTSPFPFRGPVVHNGLVDFNPQFEWTGGGFVSSSPDLARWARDLYDYRFLTPENRTIMQTGVKAKTGRDHEYGLGLQIRPSKWGKSYGHSGWFPGYLSDMAYFPELKLAAAIQFNTDNSRQLRKSTYNYLLELAALAATP